MPEKEKRARNTGVKRKKRKRDEVDSSSEADDSNDSDFELQSSRSSSKDDENLDSSCEISDEMLGLATRKRRSKTTKQSRPQQPPSTTKPRNHSSKYHQFSNNDVKETRTRLLDWYDKNQRVLPWRKPSPAFLAQHADKSFSPTEIYCADSPYDHAYAVLVSELMLQQTQVATVKSYFARWMKEFPTIEALAEAPLEKVNELWAGLGYYRRAKLLHSCAQAIVSKHNGKIPSSVDALRRLPGIGPYTAGAIASIAFDQVAPLVDGNVQRVISRVRAIASDLKNKQAESLIWSLAESLVPESRPGDFNQAIMELGATICTPQNPKCNNCPLTSVCLAYKEVSEAELQIEDLADSCSICTNFSKPEDVTAFPLKAVKKKPKDLVTVTCVVARKLATSYEFLLFQRPSSGLLAGFWEFPSVDVVDRDSNDSESEELPISKRQEMINTLIASKLPTLTLADVRVEPATRTHLGSTRHLFSHIKQKLIVEAAIISCDCPTNGGDSWRWVTNEEFETLAISKGTRKCMDLFRQQFVEKSKASSAKPQKKRAKTAAKSTAPQKQRTITQMFVKNSEEE